MLTRVLTVLGLMTVSGFSQSVSKGFEHFYNLEYADAIREFQAAVAKEPNNPNVFNHLAQAVLYQEMFRAVGVEPSKVPILALKSTVHFRADFQPIAETILVVQSPGAHITDPVDMPYKHLRKGIKLRPMGPVWNGA